MKEDNLTKAIRRKFFGMNYKEYKEALKRNWHTEYRKTSEIFADKLRKIRFIFKEWENDINRTGEKLYR